MKIIRQLISFYKTFAFASVLMSIVSLSAIYIGGVDSFTIVFWFKIITLGLIYYYMDIYKKEIYCYYKNVGVTKKQLWISVLFFDIVIFLISVYLTLKIR